MMMSYLVFTMDTFEDDIKMPREYFHHLKSARITFSSTRVRVVNSFWGSKLYYNTIFL